MNGCEAARKFFLTSADVTPSEQRAEVTKRANHIFEKHNDIGRKTVEPVK